VSDRKDLRARLCTALHDRSVTAANKALSAEPFDSELKEMAAIKSLLDFLPAPKGTQFYVAGTFAGVCVLVVAILWTVHWPTVRVQVTVRSDSLTWQVKDQYDWSGRWNLGSSLVRLQEMSKVRLPPELSPSGDLGERAWLDLEGGNFELTRLVSAPGQTAPGHGVSMSEKEPGSVELKFRSGAIELRSSSGAFDGELAVSGMPRVAAGHSAEPAASVDGPVQLDVPVSVAFHHSGHGGAPAVLAFSPRESLMLRDIHVTGINFLTQADAGTSSFRSGIRGGTLVIVDTGETVSLAKASRLDLANATGLIGELTIDSEGLTVTFDGDVTDARLGPLGYQRELMPTILEYLYHQQKFGFLFTAASFVWSLLWSGRQLLFS
jgi:hypothetical protein